MSSYRIVVGVDFSEASSHALLHALRVLGATEHGELHLTHVVLDANAGHGANVQKDEALMEDAFQRLRGYLVDLKSGSHGEPFERQVVYHVRLGDDVARALEQVAFDVDANLVVVGTHGRKGLEKWMLGSVAEKLLENGRVPVLVARPTSFEGMKRTEHLEPPKPGVNVHAARYDLVYSSERVSFAGRPSHIAGLV